MSIFKKIKRGVRHTAKQAERTVEHSGKQVEHVADKAADTVEKSADQLGEVVMSLNPEHIADEIKHEILSAINQVKNEAVQAVRTAENEAKTEIQNLAKEAERGLRDIIQAVEGKTAEEVLDFAVVVAKTIEPSNIYLHLGPLAIDIPHPIKRIEHLEHYAKHPPKTRSEWKDLITTILPSTIYIMASIGFAFIVESSDLELEVQASVTGEDVVNKVDKILTKAGII